MVKAARYASVCEAVKNLRWGRSTTLTILSKAQLVELEPSAFDGYWFVTSIDLNVGVAGTKRPISQAAIESALNAIGVPLSAACAASDVPTGEPATNNRYLRENPKHRKPSRTRCKVYFIQQADDPLGLIKIGSAQDVDDRIATFLVGCPVELKVLAVIKDGSISLERKLHRKFAALHSRGEWFRPGEELLDFIARVKNGRKEAAR